MKTLPFRKLLRFLGPGFIVTVGFIDPGNWATNIEGGGYDRVAMATHGHTFIGDLLFGSVSRSLKHKIRIPLLLIKPD